MQRLERFNTSIVGHLSYLNINSMRNNVEMIPETIANFDIFLISESKIDSTLSYTQFKINKYKLFRCDHNKFGVGLMLYLNKKITCKYLNSHPIILNAEIICIEFH